MGRITQPCGFIDGRYSTWLVQNFSRMKVEKLGGSRTISFKSPELESTGVFPLSSP